MSVSSSSRGKTVAIAVIAAFVLGGAAWGYTKWTHPAEPKKLAEADPAKAFDKMREIMERKDLTDEERRTAMEEARQAMEARMKAEMDAYFAAKTDDDKNAMLDKNIDEMQKRMEEMRARRDASSQPAASQPDGPPPEMRRMFGSQTPQERKTRSESRSPDQMARQMAYMQAMRKRMEQRGIKMPFGPGRGGPGGPGGFGGPPR